MSCIGTVRRTLFQNLCVAKGHGTFEIMHENIIRNNSFYTIFVYSAGLVTMGNLENFADLLSMERDDAG